MLPKNWAMNKEELEALKPLKDAAKLPPKALRPQQHIMEGLLKKNKDVNVCGNCRNAYRGSNGEVLCGNKESGKFGEEIRKPFEDNCKWWHLRRREQPPIYEDRERNVRFARHVQLMDELASKVKRGMRQ